MTPRFAWPTYREQWDCRASSFVLDGQEASDYIDDDYLRLNSTERHWETAVVDIAVSTDEALPSGLKNQTAHVLVACSASQLRRTYPMTPASDGQSFEAKLAISRASL